MSADVDRLKKLAGLKQNELLESLEKDMIFETPAEKRAFEETIKYVDLRMVNLETRLEDRIDEKIINLETRLDEKIDNLETRINERFVGVETRLSNIENNLDGIQDDMKLLLKKFGLNHK